MAKSETTIIRPGLIRLGFKPERFDYIIAIAGNPNTGKSTVFNALTGLRQHTGNWPGKTVVKTEGQYTFQNKRFQVVDLPGTYSLLSQSVDEEIARDFILFGKPDAVCVVVDASRLERNMNLVLQILQITDKPILCLNMMDEAERDGLEINDAELSRELGVPVVPMVARQGKGIQELVETIHAVVSGTLIPQPKKIKLDEQTQNAVNNLIPYIDQLLPGIPNAQWIALRVLENDEKIIDALKNKELEVWLKQGNNKEVFA